MTKGVSSLQVFESQRVLIQMIVQSCVGMFPFFFILMATVFMFALVNFQQAMMKPIKDPKKAPKFLAFLGD